jgi:hypothetical protein
LKEKSHAEGLVELMLDGDWQRDEDRDVAHPTADSDIDWNLVSKLNERGTHTPRQSFHVVVFFVVIGLRFWQTFRAVDKEKSLKSYRLPIGLRLVSEFHETGGGRLSMEDLEQATL